MALCARGAPGTDYDPASAAKRFAYRSAGGPVAARGARRAQSAGKIIVCPTRRRVVVRLLRLIDHRHHIENTASRAKLPGYVKPCA